MLDLILIAIVGFQAWGSLGAAIPITDTLELIR